MKYSTQLSLEQCMAHFKKKCIKHNTVHHNYINYNIFKQYTVPLFPALNYMLNVIPNIKTCCNFSEEPNYTKISFKKCSCFGVTNKKQIQQLSPCICFNHKIQVRSLENIFSSKLFSLVKKGKKRGTFYISFLSQASTHKTLPFHTNVTTSQ